MTAPDPADRPDTPPPPPGPPVPGYGPPPGYAPPAYGPPPGYGPQAYGPPPGYGPPQAYGAPYGYGPGPGEDKVWAILSHVSIFAFALLGPLVIYLIYKDRAPFTRHHAAEALNFHLTLAIATFVAIILSFLLIGIPILIALFIVGPVFAIIAAVKAGAGEPYRYPLTIHFVK